MASVLGHALAIETVTGAQLGSDAVSFRLALGGRHGCLRMPAALVELCLRSLGVDRVDRLSAVQCAMLLELALLDSVKSLEARLGLDVRVEARLKADEPEDGVVPLYLKVRGLPSDEAVIEIRLDRRNVDAVASALDEFSAPNPAAERLLIPVRIRLDTVDLTFGELRSLRVGDIVLLEGDSQSPRGPTAVVAERLQALVEATAEGFRFTSPLTHAAVSSEGDLFMQQPGDPPNHVSLGEADLAQLPIRVVFELGRLDLPLAEIRRFAPGHLLPLARPSESAVDIVANGRKLGYGSLVKIGDSIGVRIERLVTDE
jgi:type III secretion protein Q